MKVWIDFHNSPHPLLFAPVVTYLNELGHTVALTARDNAQTVELACERWPEIVVIGGASPAKPAAKAAGIVHRIEALRRWAASERPDVALSHNSYAQLVASRLLGIPAVTTMDYEHQPANHLAFRVASRVLIPESLPRSAVQRQGASAAKTQSYPGLKEEIYLGNFDPDENVLRHLGVELGAGGCLVVTRPPPSGAAYHQFENPVYVDALRVLAAQRGIHCVVLARTAEQRENLVALGFDNFSFPDQAVDSRSLMFAADLVLGAGGTMTREAALLGVPTFSVFAGRPSAVDASLTRRGLLRPLTTPQELANIGPRTSEPPPLAHVRARGRMIVEQFVQVTLQVAGWRCAG